MSANKRRLRRRFKGAGDAIVGALAIGTLRLVRRTNYDRMANFAGWLMRTIGPLFRENRIARAQLTAAFPEKSTAEIDTILRGVWDNLGRMGAEFAPLGSVWAFVPG